MKEVFLAVLYLHVLATVALVGDMGAEAVALGHVRVNHIPGMRIATSICLGLASRGGRFSGHHSRCERGWCSEQCG